MPHHPLVRRRRAAIVLPVMLFALAGCGVLKPGETALAVVTPRVVGMPAGEFFDRYGRASRRTEVPGGTTDYLWESQVPKVSAGMLGLDERICRLRLSVDLRGRIDGVQVVTDAQGLTSLSRCGEIFAPS